jgi:hypothetical protein
METNESEPMKERKRKVFGRIKLTVNKVPIIFELQKDGLHIRRKYSRHGKVLNFEDLSKQAEEQPELSLA